MDTALDNLATRPHAQFSPSRLSMLKACPMWRSDNAFSADAQRGVSLGDQLARYALGQAVELPEEAEYGKQEIDRIASLYDGEWAAETMLDTGINDVWGYADLILSDSWSDEAVLVEFKSGWGKREPASENVQVKAYALGMLRLGLSKVTAYLVELDRRKTSEAVFLSSGSEELEREIAGIVEAAQSATFDHARTGTQCKYCGNKEVCPEMAMTPEAAKALATMQNHKHLEPAEFAKSLSTESLAATLKRVLPLFELAETYVGHLKSRAIALIEAGETVPGFRVKERKGARKWIDEQAAMDALKAAGVNIEPLIVTELLSPAKAEKLIPKEQRQVMNELVALGAPSKSLEVEE